MASKKKQSVAFIFIGGEIDSEKAEQFHTQLLEAENQADVIVIRICSEGGEIGAGLSIHDAIKLSSKKTVTEVWGEAYSISALILQGGKVRRASPNSRVMIHAGRATLDGVLGQRDIKNLETDLGYLNELYARLLTERTKASDKKIKEWIAAETYFTAEEALKYGFIDHIIGEKNVKG